MTLLTITEVASRLHKSRRWLDGFLKLHPHYRCAGRTKLFTEADVGQLELALLVHTERKARAGPDNRDGILYFIEAGDCIKIGFSRNLESRLQSMTSASTVPLQVLHTEPGTRCPNWPRGRSADRHSPSPGARGRSRATWWRTVRAALCTAIVCGGNAVFECKAQGQHAAVGLQVVWNPFSPEISFMPVSHKVEERKVAECPKEFTSFLDGFRLVCRQSEKELGWSAAQFTAICFHIRSRHVGILGIKLEDRTKWDRLCDRPRCVQGYQFGGSSPVILKVNHQNDIAWWWIAAIDLAASGRRFVQFDAFNADNWQFGAESSLGVENGRLGCVLGCFSGPLSYNDGSSHVSRLLFGTFPNYPELALASLPQFVRGSLQSEREQGDENCSYSSDTRAGAIKEFSDMSEKDKSYVMSGAIFVAGLILLTYLGIRGWFSIPYYNTYPENGSKQNSKDKLVAPKSSHDRESPHS